MKPEVSEWLKIAEEDMASARLLFENGIHRMVCLHSQQAVEKILKAILMESDVKLRKIHNIIDLLSLARTEGVSMNMTHEEAGFLNAVYRSRYPAEAGLLPQGEPTANDAGRALALAQRVFEEGKQMLERRG